LLLLYFITFPILFAFPQKTCSGACPMAMDKNNSEMQMNKTTGSRCEMMMEMMIIRIVGENALFLIHYIRLFRKEGMKLKPALIEAGKVRLRPIFLTTFAAVLALMQQPLAISVIGGFSLSAFLLLFLLPLFYLVLHNE